MRARRKTFSASYHCDGPCGSVSLYRDALHSEKDTDPAPTGVECRKSARVEARRMAALLLPPEWGGRPHFAGPSGACDETAHSWFRGSVILRPGRYLGVGAANAGWRRSGRRSGGWRQQCRRRRNHGLGRRERLVGVEFERRLLRKFWRNEYQQFIGVGRYEGRRRSTARGSATSGARIHRRWRAGSARFRRQRWPGARGSTRFGRQQQRRRRPRGASRRRPRHGEWTWRDVRDD